MSTTPLPEIPATGDERTLLLAFLDYHRVIVRRKAEGLTDAQLREPLPGHPSALSVGNILKHLAWVEVKWARHVFLGVGYDQIDEPWATRRGTDDDWEWDVSGDSATDVLGWYDDAVAIARACYASADDLETLSVIGGSKDPGEQTDDDGPRFALRWILLHLLEEYARHAGHLDLLRERIDGATGN